MNIGGSASNDHRLRPEIRRAISQLATPLTDAVHSKDDMNKYSMDHVTNDMADCNEMLLRDVGNVSVFYEDCYDRPI